MKKEKLKDNFIIQLIFICIVGFLIVFLPQRIFIGLSFNSSELDLWNKNLLGPSFGPIWLFTGSAILFLVTFLTCLLSSFIVSITLKDLKTGIIASILLCIMAISPTIIILITITIDPTAFYVPFFYYIKYELSIAIIISAVCGAIGGSVYGSLLIRDELDLPLKNPVMAIKRMKLMQKSSYVKSIIFMIIGIPFFASIYLIQTDIGSTHGFRIILFLFLIASVPIIGYGYISLMNRIDLKKGCLIEGMVAIIIPQILIIFHLSLFIHKTPFFGIFILILILGLVSFILSFFGYFGIRSGNIKRGLISKLFLRLLLLIGGAFSFLIVGFLLFSPSSSIF